MTTPLPDVAAVRSALERRDMVYGLTVDRVMSVVGPVLEERDAEITRLRRLLAEFVVTDKTGIEDGTGGLSGRHREPCADRDTRDVNRDTPPGVFLPWGVRDPPRQGRRVLDEWGVTVEYTQQAIANGDTGLGRSAS